MLCATAILSEIKLSPPSLPYQFRLVLLDGKVVLSNMVVILQPGPSDWGTE